MLVTLALLVVFARAGFAISSHRVTLLSRQDTAAERLRAASQALEAYQLACFEANPGTTTNDPVPDPELLQCMCTDDMVSLMEDFANIILGLSPEVAAEWQVNQDPTRLTSEAQLFREQCANNGFPVRDLILNVSNETGETDEGPEGDSPTGDSLGTSVEPSTNRPTGVTTTGTVKEPEASQSPSSAIRYGAGLLSSSVIGVFTSMMLL